MPLGQADAVFIGYEIAVVKCGRGEIERAVKQQLSKRAADEISAAHNLRDFHDGIIHHARELVGGKVVFSPHEKVAEVFASDLALRTARDVAEGDRLTFGHPKSPVHAGTRSDWMLDVGCWMLDVLIHDSRSARSWINRLVFTFVRGCERAKHILT
jgi:hypothetical protein